MPPIPPFTGTISTTIENMWFQPFDGWSHRWVAFFREKKDVANDIPLIGCKQIGRMLGFQRWNGGGDFKKIGYLLYTQLKHWNSDDL